jgi:hypothetical protein
MTTMAEPPGKCDDRFDGLRESRCPGPAASGPVSRLIFRVDVPSYQP